MSDLAARISPTVLAAALREVEGVVLDPATPDGQRASAELVSRLMSDEGTAERLLGALERHGASEAAEVAVPETYGPVAVAAPRVPVDLNDEPPTGSAEFEAFVRGQAHSQQQTTSESPPPHDQSLANPSALGFQDEPVVPITQPVRQQIDVVLLAVQRRLEAEAGSARPSLMHRILAFMSNEPLGWRTRSRVLANNYLRVEAVRGSSRVYWASVASKGILFVQVTTDGKVTLKERLDLTDKASAMARLTQAFAAEPQAGAEALRELRNTMVDVTPSTAIRAAAV